MRKGVIALLVLLSACATPVTRLTPAPSPTPTLGPSPTPLLLPSPSPTPSPTPIVYVVQPGDTLADIAALYETTAEAICAFNELEDCSLIYPGDELLMPGEGVTPMIPTPSPTPTHTPTWTDTPTPSPTPTSTPLPTDTPTLTPTPTSTQVVPPATPTPTFTPTLTPTPSYEFMYEEGSMQTAPNCGTVYLRIKVVGVGGEPVNDVTVRLQWITFIDHKITGRGGEPAGEVGFTPLGLESYHSPMDFHIQLVQSPSDPTPRSNEKIVHFIDCDTAGQFTNIKFVYQW